MVPPAFRPCARLAWVLLTSLGLDLLDSCTWSDSDGIPGRNAPGVPALPGKEPLGAIRRRSGPSTPHLPSVLGATKGSGPDPGWSLAGSASAPSPEWLAFFRRRSLTQHVPRVRTPHCAPCVHCGELPVSVPVDPDGLSWRGSGGGGRPSVLLQPLDCHRLLCTSSGLACVPAQPWAA